VRKSQTAHHSELEHLQEASKDQLNGQRDELEDLQTKTSAQLELLAQKLQALETKGDQLRKEFMLKDEQIKNLKVYSELNNNKSETDSSEFKRKVDQIEKTLGDSLAKFVGKDDVQKELQKYAYKRDLEFAKEELSMCAKDFKVNKLAKDIESTQKLLQKLYMNKIDVRELVHTTAVELEKKLQRETDLKVQTVNIKVIGLSRILETLEETAGDTTKEVKMMKMVIDEKLDVIKFASFKKLVTETFAYKDELKGLYDKVLPAVKA